MFNELEAINKRPEAFAFYTASELWTDEHTSERMLTFHLNEAVDISSRNAGFIDQSVKWIVSRFNIGGHSKIIDFGCGPGLYTTRFAGYRAHVTGVDFSGRSIKYAQEVADREQLSINYVNRNYLDFETDEQFDLILMIMCDFCALSPAQRRSMLEKFHRMLKPGGAVILDVYSLAAFDKKEEQVTYGENSLNGFWSLHKYYCFLNTFKYDNAKVVLDKYTIIEPHRSRTVYNWLQYFAPADLEKEFAQAGFMIEEVCADVKGTPFDRNADEFAVIAGKM